MIYLGPQTNPTAWLLEVRSANPWTTPSVVVHRGLGGGTQTVWTAAPPEAGQRFVHRCPAADVPAVLAQLAAPGRVTLTTEDGCAFLPMPAAVITAVDVSYRYDVAPPAADVTIDVAAV